MFKKRAVDIQSNLQSLSAEQSGTLGLQNEMILKVQTVCDELVVVKQNVLDLQNQVISIY